VLGADPFGAPAGWRDRIGVVLQSSVPEPDLTVRETIDLYAGFYARPRPTDEVLDLTGLTAQAAARNSRLSGGQQRRLDVALALVGDPDVLFLDEPTTGFDPAARRAAWETLAGLKALGKTVFLTTHYLDEAEYLADRIAVITDGRIAAVGTPSELGGRHCKPSTVRLRLGPIADPVQLPQWLAEGWWRIDHGCIAFSSGDPATDVHRLVEWAMSEGRHVDMLEVLPPSLEDTYLELTQGGQH
jgi:ABC-2 type transport system ATP-binding protein